MKCPDCNSEMLSESVPVWHDVKIPFLNIILIFGRWRDVRFCHCTGQEEEYEKDCRLDEAYLAGKQEGYDQAENEHAGDHKYDQF